MPSGREPSRCGRPRRRHVLLLRSTAAAAAAGIKDAQAGNSHWCPFGVYPLIVWGMPLASAGQVPFAGSYFLAGLGRSELRRDLTGCYLGPTTRNRYPVNAHYRAVPGVARPGRPVRRSPRRPGYADASKIRWLNREAAGENPYGSIARGVGDCRAMMCARSSPRILRTVCSSKHRD